MHNRTIATASSSRSLRRARRAAPPRGHTAGISGPGLRAAALAVLLATVAASGLAARGVREEPSGRAEPEATARFVEISAVSAESCPCPGGAVPAGDRSAADYRILATGTNASQNERLIARADDPAGLSALWDRVARTRVPPPEPPEVDFAEEILVVIFAGQRPSGGYSLEVDGACRGATGADAAANDRAGAGAAAADAALHVCYTLYEPREGAMVTMALTSPYLFLAVKRPVDEIVAHRRTATR